MHDGGDGRQAEGWAAFYAALGRLRQTIERLQRPLKSCAADAPETLAEPSGGSSKKTASMTASCPAGCETDITFRFSQRVRKDLQHHAVPVSAGPGDRLHTPVPAVPAPEIASSPAKSATAELQDSADDTQATDEHTRGKAAHQHQPSECTQLKQEWLPEDFVVDEQYLAVPDPWLSTGSHDQHLLGMDAAGNEAGTSSNVASEEKTTEFELETHDADDAGALSRTDGVATQECGDVTTLAADIRPPFPSDAAAVPDDDGAGATPLAENWPQRQAQPRETTSSPGPAEHQSEGWETASEPLLPTQRHEGAHDALTPPTLTVANAPVIEPVHTVVPVHEQDIPGDDLGMSEWDMLEGLATVSSSTNLSGINGDSVNLGDSVPENYILTFDEHHVVLPDPVDDVREDPFAAHAGGAPSTLHPSLPEEEAPARFRALDKALEIAELLEDCTSQRRIIEAAAWLETFFLENRVHATYEALLRLAQSGCTFEELQHVIALRQLCQDQGYNLIRRYRGSGGWVAECTFPPPYARILELVRARRDYPVEMMIREEWLGEWWQLSPGSVGFTSFMEYACIRAGTHVAVDDLPLFAAADDEGHCADHHDWTRRLYLSCPGDRDDPAPPLRHVLPRPRCGRLISLPPPRT